MSQIVALSDQFYTWSARNAGQIHRHIEATTQNARASTASLGSDPARLLDRALQALRETHLQMCAGAGTRPQVLSLGQSHRRATGDGLCAASRLRTRGAVSWQLSSRSRPPRGALCHQSRAPAPPRGLLNIPNERSLPAHCSLRCPPCRHAPRQHARGVARHPSTSWVIGGQS